jgi:hypothetical protein
MGRGIGVGLTRQGRGVHHAVFNRNTFCLSGTQRLGRGELVKEYRRIALEADEFRDRSFSPSGGRAAQSDKIPDSSTGFRTWRRRTRGAAHICRAGSSLYASGWGERCIPG